MQYKKIKSITLESPVSTFWNVEQIPAEAMSHRLAKADKVLFGDAQPFDIYSNQFVPLWDNDSTVWEKMQKDGQYNSLLTGGGISHINTGEHITSKQAEKLINYAVKSNCEHFAITGTFCKCEDGHVVIGDTESCAICGKPITIKIARTVGFFTPVQDWNTAKIEYDFKRRHEYTNGDFD
jgi:ribonucleoside-triphosphate reductase